MCEERARATESEAGGAEVDRPRGAQRRDGGGSESASRRRAGPRGGRSDPLGNKCARSEPAPPRAKQEAQRSIAREERSDETEGAANRRAEGAPVRAGVAQTPLEINVRGASPRHRERSRRRRGRSPARSAATRRRGQRIGEPKARRSARGSLRPPWK